MAAHDPEELALAARCTTGDPAALAEFQTRFGRVIEATARRFGDATFAAEIGQLVLARLLSTADGKPRIAEFQGRGGLAKYVQAVTTRVALNHLSSNQRHAHVQNDDALVAFPAGGDDPELATLKSHYRAEFKAAFGRAMASLEGPLRNALRLHYLDGLTLGEIGALHQWSVPTASRRLAAAREQVLVATRKILTDELKLSPRELDSVLRLIESRLSVEGLVAG